MLTAGAVEAAPARTASRSRRARETSVLGRSSRGSFLYVLPAAALFATFTVYPILANIAASLTGAHGRLVAARYTEAAADPVFWTALGNSVLWVVLCVIGEIAIGFTLGVLIELSIRRFRTGFRTLLFLPMVITPSVIALVFTTLSHLITGCCRACSAVSGWPTGSLRSWAIRALPLWGSLR